MKINFLWFVSGFSLGLTLLSLSFAALQKGSGSKAPPLLAPSVQSNEPITEMPITEMKVDKIAAPDLDKDFSALSNAEAAFAEGRVQQDRLRTSTSRASTKNNLGTQKKIRR